MPFRWFRRSEGRSFEASYRTAELRDGTGLVGHAQLVDARRHDPDERGSVAASLVAQGQGQQRRDVDWDAQ